MSLAKYEIFTTVVELQSLTKAAEALNLTQSAVSHAISSLEAGCGFALLIRSKAGIQLTANGERILPYMREILKWNEMMHQEIQLLSGIQTGTVRIGTFTSVSSQWLPGVIKSFQHEYPAIHIKLKEGDYGEIKGWIASGAVDFGFLSLQGRSIFDTIPLKKDRLVCILPDGHALALESSLHLDQLREEPFIMPKWGGDDEIESMIRTHKVKLSIRFEVAEEQAIIGMVQHGLGISILPEMVLGNLPDTVRIVPLAEKPYRMIGMAALSLSELSPAAHKFINSVQDWLTLQHLMDDLGHLPSSP
ncbi:LysR family transcriptional regulator [Paenibacillus shunpengii]|uniref:LysR family transcriptional regulator n=1 Tax=Paenibacillus shunpengii TaxID=2054424 RepID=A0ABW5SKK0_9BACL|nr:LysR family transcriptional regulator [Paenibacillus sp. FSL H7-0326]OMC70877.1 LysR family transcriptional regulator [Paenibacillus sp. FSL H7-0326]